jgi:2-polyprenyl-3-methyl-5-hydroxy-6-metoxy-1,4-benzoquinol methylase
MNWKDFWNKQQAETNAYKQVGRVLNGQAISPETMSKIAARIAKQLQLQKTDIVLDVCCGNGVLDTLLLPSVTAIHGVDLSDALLAEAKQLNFPNLTFSSGNAVSFGLNQTFDKSLLYFSFQYIETLADAQKVIENLVKHTKKDSVILIGDIPNQLEFFTFYNTPSKWWQWIKQELKGANEMGRFWHPKELLQICENIGLRAEIQTQEPWQPYAHYRFDLLIYS